MKRSSEQRTRVQPMTSDAKRRQQRREVAASQRPAGPGMPGLRCHAACSMSKGHRTPWSPHRDSSPPLLLPNPTPKPAQMTSTTPPLVLEMCAATDVPPHNPLCSFCTTPSCYRVLFCLPCPVLSAAIVPTGVPSPAHTEQCTCIFLQPRAMHLSPLPSPCLAACPVHCTVHGTAGLLFIFSNTSRGPASCELRPAPTIVAACTSNAPHSLRSVLPCQAKLAFVVTVAVSRVEISHNTN